jgi:hypothetical protein
MHRIHLRLSLVLISLAGLVACQGSSANPTRQPKDHPYSTAMLRDAVVTYLNDQTFSSADLLKQITGSDAELELHDGNEQMLYFTESAVDDKTLPRLDLLTRAPEKVEFGKLEGNRLVLGNYGLSIPGKFLFRFPAADFRVPPDAIVTTKFGKTITYTQTMREMTDFIANRTVYGGYLNARHHSVGGPEETVFINHGAFVAMKGEPSLTRLVAQLVRPEHSPEVKAQRLLHFVTLGLRYKHEEAERGFETMKRPNEVLMSGGSDCSGLAICYASLLEQTDVDYYLLYVFRENGLNHLTVVVRGEFQSLLSASIKIGDGLYYQAETTVPEFQIGQTWQLNQGLEGVQYVQRPREKNRIVELSTGQPLDFE